MDNGGDHFPNGLEQPCSSSANSFKQRPRAVALSHFPGAAKLVADLRLAASRLGALEEGLLIMETMRY